jgi:hypothetical protein
MDDPENDVPFLPMSPMKLTCPFCHARPFKDCATVSGRLSVIHVQRIAAAAKRDVGRKRRREEMK